jgi:hypothetical protein
VSPICLTRNHPGCIGAAMKHRDVVCPVCGAGKARACVGVYGTWYKRDGKRVLGELVHFARIAEAQR